MALNIFFLFLYVALSSTVDGITMSALFILHCLLKLIALVRQKQKGVHITMAFYFGVALIAFANLGFIYKINVAGLKEYFIYNYIVVDRIVEGTALWAIGNTFIFIGFDLFKKVSFPKIMIEIKNKRVLDNIFRFTLFAILLRLTGNAINFTFITGGLQKILLLLNFMSIMFFARLWVVEKNVRYRNYSLTLAALQTTAALFTSYLRSDLMTPALSFFGGYFIGLGGIKYIFSYRILPLVGLGLLFSMFFNSLSATRSHFISAFTEDEPAIGMGYTDQSIQSNERGGVLDRSSNIAQLTNIINLVKKNGHYDGRASFPLVAALIPRFLWKDKPNIELGAWFALEIGVATISPATGRANNSINMTIPGQLYLDFGWVGVIVGCVLMGGLLSAFWAASAFNESPYNLTGSLWGGYLLFNSLFGLGSDLQIVISLVSTYLTFILLNLAIKSYEGTFSRTAVARK